MRPTKPITLAVATAIAAAALVGAALAQGATKSARPNGEIIAILKQARPNGRIIAILKRADLTGPQNQLEMRKAGADAK